MPAQIEREEGLADLAFRTGVRVNRLGRFRPAFL